MGVTLGNKNRTIDLGYGGFFRLRSKVAHLTNEELGKFYDQLCEMHSYGDDQEKFLEAYNKRLQNIDEELGVSAYILDFLYTSDCDGVLSVKHCRRLYNVIKDYDDDVIYGYFGRKEAAKFKDFKEIVKECCDKNIMLRWY